jgi:hypothetical protein
VRLLRRHIVLAIAAVACASGPSQLYEGPALPREQIALITRAPGGKARVYAIDRSRVSGDSFWVLPGAHSVWVSFQVTRHGGDMTYTIWAYCQIEVETAAGEAYVVHSIATQEQMMGPAVKTQLGAQISNAEGRVVGSALTCSGKRPRLG